MYRLLVRAGATLAAVGLLAACADAPLPSGPDLRPNLIVNGEPTGAAYGSVGALLFDFNADGTIDGDDQWCTGSLISRTVFLTAAHCVVSSWTPPGSQFYVSFAPDLYARSIRAISATGYEADPEFGHDNGDLHDLAVVFLPEAATKGMTTYALPKAGELDALFAKGALNDALFVNVGYGTGATRTGPPSFPYDGVRKMSKSEFANLEPAWLLLLMNERATGEGGDCYGDSGGPKFLDGNATKIYATVTGGDVPCRATSKDYRLDTPIARAFLGQFVTLP